jgi:hypothetical protein
MTTGASSRIYFAAWPNNILAGCCASFMMGTRRFSTLAGFSDLTARAVRHFSDSTAPHCSCQVVDAKLRELVACLWLLDWLRPVGGEFIVALRYRHLGTDRGNGGVDAAQGSAKLAHRYQ